MMIKLFRILVSVTFAVVLFAGITACKEQKNVKSKKEEAIELAEQFIIDNGYTDLPADKSKLSYELFEKNADAVLEKRFNTLHRKAFCVSEDEDRWHIGFLSTNVDRNKLDSMQLKADLPGRAVTVMKNTNEVKMAHKTPLFSHFEKLNN